VPTGRDIAQQPETSQEWLDHNLHAGVSGEDPLEPNGAQSGPDTGSDNPTQDQPSDVDKPATPQASGPEAGEPAGDQAGPGENPQTGESPQTGQNPPGELPDLDETGLSTQSKFLIGGGFGAAANVTGAYLHGDHDPRHLEIDAVAGFVSGGLAAVPEDVTTLVTAGGVAAAWNSAATQLVGSGSINYKVLAMEGVIGMGLGEVDPLAEQLGGVESDLQRALITGESAILAATCDLGGLPVGVPVCGNGKAGP
jgi:hypothetical protein